MANRGHLIEEHVEPGIFRIWLNRPEVRNAQNVAMLYQLNDAIDAAVADDDVKVIILAARGPHFSAGHDLKEATLDVLAARSGDRVTNWSRGDNAPGAAHFYAGEKELYEGLCRRWRDTSKPVVVAVQGKCIAGGLMLVWPFDFVIAAEDAVFQDNTIYMGLPGVEYFAHVWELGIRKGKEFLLTGQPIDAHEAHQFGMVNHVVPTAELEQRTVAFARTLADKPLFALQLAKSAINSAFDAPSFDSQQKIAFNAHHLSHTHYRLMGGEGVEPSFIESFRNRKNTG